MTLPAPFREKGASESPEASLNKGLWKEGCCSRGLPERELLHSLPGDVHSSALGPAFLQGLLPLPQLFPNTPTASWGISQEPWAVLVQ